MLNLITLLGLEPHYVYLLSDHRCRVIFSNKIN